jgi:hypothetical protein
MNNPLMFTDPTGEEWWNWLLGGALSGGAIPSHYLFKGAGHASTSWMAGFIDGMDGNGGGWREADARAHNSWKISKGLFIADEDGSDWDKFWEVLSRHTIQQPWTEMGNLYAHLNNNVGRIDVEYFHGATVIYDYSFMGKGGGVTLGSYITMDRYEYFSKNNKSGIKNKSDYSNLVLMHEYGHYLQSRQWGGARYGPNATFSSASFSDQQNIWVEQDANARSISYFETRMTENEILGFNNEYESQYYDARFVQNYFWPDNSSLYIINLIWSK